MTHLPCTHAAKIYIISRKDELCPQKRGKGDMSNHILSGQGFLPDPG